jgi:hypothetical protein
MRVLPLMPPATVLLAFAAVASAQTSLQLKWELAVSARWTDGCQRPRHPVRLLETDAMPRGAASRASPGLGDG